MMILYRLYNDTKAIWMGVFGMLLQFSVENYKSFKDKAILSLEASSDKELLDHVLNNGKDRYLKSVALFGANAAGKSNLFQLWKLR